MRVHSGDPDNDRLIRNAAGKVDAERPSPLAFDTGWSVPAIVGAVAWLALARITNNAVWAAGPGLLGIAASGVLLIRRYIRQNRYKSRSLSAGMETGPPSSTYTPPGKGQRLIIGLLAVAGGFAALVVSLHRLGVLR